MAECGAATPQEVLAGLTNVALGRIEFPAYDKAGDKYMCSPTVAERLKALELLGKHYMLFSERAEQSDNVIRVELGAGVDALAQ